MNITNKISVMLISFCSFAWASSDVKDDEKSMPPYMRVFSQARVDKLDIAAVMDIEENLRKGSDNVTDLQLWAFLEFFFDREKEKGITQKIVADLLGVSQASVSNFMTRKSIPSRLIDNLRYHYEQGGVSWLEYDFRPRYKRAWAYLFGGKPTTLGGYTSVETSARPKDE